MIELEIDKKNIDEFSSLLEQTGNIKRGVLMSAIVTKIDSKYVFVDVGIKSEGRILKEEFNVGQEDNKLPEPGSSVTVLLEALEDKNGDVLLSYTKALREEGWAKLEEVQNKRQSVQGSFVRKVQGGCIVNLSGVSAFLPKNNLPANFEIKDFFGKQFSFLIAKMDRAKSNIVVSLNGLNNEIYSNNFSEGQIIAGTVKSLTESTAFIDLGGVVGRLHVGEISWERIKEPSEVLKIGDKIDLKIISISNGGRISLSYRELQENPWLTSIKKAGIEEGKIVDATIKIFEDNFAILNILPSNIEGRLKVSEVAWSKGEQNFDHLKINQNIQVKINEIDSKKSRVFLSIKQMEENPFEAFALNNKVGNEIECAIISEIEDFYIAKIDSKIDGLVSKKFNNLKHGITYNFVIKEINSEMKSVILEIKK